MQNFKAVILISHNKYIYSYNHNKMVKVTVPPLVWPSFSSQRVPHLFGLSVIFVTKGTHFGLVDIFVTKGPPFCLAIVFVTKDPPFGLVISFITKGPPWFECRFRHKGSPLWFGHRFCHKGSPRNRCRLYVKIQ